MGQVLLLFLTFIAAYLGFALFAVSQTQHRQRISSNAATGSLRKPLLRTCGSILLAGSLVIAIWRDGPAFGSILWCVLLTLAALTLTFTLTLTPHRLRPLLWLAKDRR